MDNFKWKFWKVINIIILLLPVLVKLLGVDNTKKELSLVNGIYFISLKLCMFINYE